MPNCVLASVNKTFQEKCTDVSKFFLRPKIWFGETEEYQDQSKDILNSILNEDVLSDSDSEEPIEES